MRQWISIGMADEVFRLRTSYEITTLMFRIAPCAGGVPVPCCALQLSILPIGDRPPSGRKGLSQNVGGVNLVDNSQREDVDGCAQSHVRIEGFDLVRRRRVYANDSWRRIRFGLPSKIQH